MSEGPQLKALGLSGGLGRLFDIFTANKRPKSPAIGVRGNRVKKREFARPVSRPVHHKSEELAFSRQQAR